MLQNLDPLSDHHIRNLGDVALAILAARALGYAPKEIAERTFKGLRTIGAQIERVEDIICVPLGLRRDPVVAGFWFREHMTCRFGCAKRAVQMIQSDTVFDVIMRGRATDANTS